MSNFGEVMAAAFNKYAPPKPRQPTREDYWRQRLQGQGAISKPQTTIGGLISEALTKGAKKAGIGDRHARRIAGKATAALTDLTPVGDAEGAQEGSRQFTRGLETNDLVKVAIGAGVFGLSMVPYASKARQPLNALMRDEGGALSQKLTPGYHHLEVGPASMDLGVSPDLIGELQLLRVPADERGRGHARTAMQELVETADRDGVMLALTPDPMDATTSKRRLEAFYREFGFVPNSGRAKNFSTRAGMIRPR